MDQHFPHHHHHHQQQQPQQHRTRYAPVAPQQSHHHNPHNLPPPPPLPQPPPPPPLSYRTIHTPPPHPYNPPPPHQSSQFPFYPHRPIEEERPLSTTNHHHHHSSFSNRTLPDDHHPRLIDRIDRRNPEPLCNPSTDDRPTRNYPPLDFDRELHHRNHRPPPPPPPLSYPPLRYDAEGGCARERHEGHTREDFVWGRGNSDGSYHRRVPADVAPNQAAMSRDSATATDSKSGGYGRIYDVECDADVSTRAGRVDTRRWVNDRKGLRELHDSSNSFELVNNEIGVPVKREYYGSEIVRYNTNNYRGNNSREYGHEFTRTPPKKQIQKKSALLRLQTVKPNHRSRDVEQLRYAGYVPESNNNNFFRGNKEQHGYFSGHGMKAEEKEESSVELDISFESNSLVAKAIVPAPSSSGAPVSDSNTTSVSDANLEKSKKVSVSDGDCAGSQPAKPTSGGGSLNDSPCKANDNTSQKNEGDTCSQPCTTSNPHEKIKVAVSGKVSDSCSGKLSARVVKKKKIVKRVVKKAVVNPKSTVSRSPSANAVGGTVQEDSVTLSSSTASGPVKTETCLEEKSTAVDKVSVPDCSHSLPKEGNVLTDDNKGDSSLLSLGPDCRSQECKADEDSDFGKVSRFERGGSISNSPSHASSSEFKNSGSDCLDANNSVHDLLSMPNIDKVTKSLNGSTSSAISHMDYGNEQLCQNEVSLSPGRYSNVGCPENRNLVDVGDEMNCKLSSSADSVISTDIIDTHNSANDRVYGFNSNYLTGSEKKFTVTDSGNNDIVGKAYCDNIAPSITQCAILEENSDTAIPMPSSGMVAFSCSGNTRIQDGLDCLPRAGVLKPGSDNGSSTLEDSITVQHFGIMKDSEKQVSLSEVAISSDNCDTEKTFPISNISVGPDERDTNMAPTFTHDAILQENSDTAIPHPSNGMIALSSSVNTEIQDGLDCLQHAGALKQGSDNGSSTLEDSITVQHFGVMKNSGKQVSPSEVAISSDNCQRDTNKIRKRKVRTHLNFVSSNRDDISPDCVNLVSHANDADRGSSLLLKDPCTSEVLDHSVQSLDFDLQSNLDGITALHGKRGILEAESYVGNNDSDDANKVSPVSKRKKVTASLPNFTQCQSEFSDAIVATTSNSEFPISFSDNQAHQKEVALSNVGILSIARSMPYSDDIAKLSDSILAGGSFGSIDANRQAMSSEHLELQHSDMVSYSPCEESAFPNVQFSVFGCEPKENIPPIVPISNSNTQTDILVTRNIKGEKTDSQAVEIDYHYSDIVHRSPRANMESNDLNMKDDLLAQQNLMSCPANGDGVTTSDSNDELIQDSPDALSDMCSRGMVSEVPDRSIIELTAIHDENFCGDEENPNDISMVKHGSDSHTFTPSMQHTEKIMKSDHGIGHGDLIKRNIMPEPTQVYPKVTTQGLNSYCSGLDGSKNQPGGVIRKTFQGHSFAFSKSKTKTSSSSIHNSKSRTWHRAGNNNPPTSLPRIKPSAGTFPPQRPTLERKGNFQNTSYIRKGNSLVRKPSSAIPQVSSANRPPLGLDEIPKNTRSEGRADVTDQSIYLKTEVSSAPLKRQRTPPLPIATKSEEKISSPLVEPPSSGCCENTSDPRKFIETNDAPDSSEDVLNQYETPENQTGPSNNGESQIEANDGNISSLNSKKIVYIQPKTNQLVATSNACDVIISTDDKGQTAFSDSYYKRRKNQLVRTTFESHINQTVAMPNSTVNSDGQRASKVLSNRRFTKRRSHKVAGISCKSSRASLVWTLRSKNSSENDRGSSHYQKVLPHLFPWKRTTYLRSFIHNSASSFNSSSLSAIGKKLLLLRKRDTVYTRSTHGFSLWKSKVLGVGGSSLKWSKSIEKHSKKANEEATLAVAAVEKKKREHKDVACIGSQAKRERIFRIGSVRYRMDPSRRTLQRISDNESQSSSICSGLAAKRAYVPRRLMIGNDEYVRIGNGNQLIRDPKKRTRKLANEKVRWSLHTARQRLARKQKYCQFFTRFGKCNKDGGKCPYIHDPSKIAVCTKFLNGLCSTPNCKLTHKVIPERMPDCSYFLQGLCSNGTCPYRHVNVNPKASICEGFLKGYCADGNECRKKHSYVCPTFEATGTCAQGTKCKLHHPKKQSKGKKRKRSGDQNNCRGRYFGSIPVDVTEPGTMLPPRQHQQQNDELEKELSDYISLDVIEDEAADTVDRSFEPSTFCDNNSLDLQLDTSMSLLNRFF